MNLIKSIVNDPLVNKRHTKLLVNELRENKLLVNELLLECMVNELLVNQSLHFAVNELVNGLIIEILIANERKRS